MNRYYYDLHIHSCLSPCADNDCTPNNIAGMGVLNGLNVMALTDHNTCRNCPAFFAAAKKHGIVAVAGMELTTSEDIHVICLFENLEDALEFDKVVYSRLIKVKNRPDIFGYQLVLDENDEVVGSEEYLLSNATDISVEEVPRLVKTMGGVCYPAHIDRESNGIISVLGTFPDYIGFTAAELHNADLRDEYDVKYGIENLEKVFSSDAHYLWDINEKSAFFDIDDEPYSSALVRKKLIEHLR